MHIASKAALGMQQGIRIAQMQLILGCLLPKQLLQIA
jgi:hypothetical protein